MLRSTIDWLLEENNPSVRYYTLTSLLGRKSDDKETLAAKKSMMETGSIPKILALQNLEGYWGDPDRFYRDKYKGTVWAVLMLAELGAESDDERIKNACEILLKNSQEPESGGFSYDRSAKTGAGLPSGVIPCLTGNVVYSLIRLGYLQDQRTQKAIEWIARYQRTDDGETERPKGKPYDRFVTCFGRHTCHMGAAKAFKALNAIPSEDRYDEVNVRIGELAEYFLKHHIYKKSHNLDEISRPGWLRPGFPLMYQTDVLELLEIFAEQKMKDSRLNDAVEIIKELQQKDGRWKLQNSFNGRTIVNIEKKGEPSKWVTLKALKVLKEYDEETRKAFEELE